MMLGMKRYDDIENEDVEQMEDSDDVDRDLYCIRACAVEMQVAISHQFCFCEFTGKRQVDNQDAHFCKPACAAEVHLNMSEGKCGGSRSQPTLGTSLPNRNPFERFTKAISQRIFKENGVTQMEHPYQAPAWTLTVQTHQCGHNVWEYVGINMDEPAATDSRQTLRT